jgi:hypothetical protein
MHYSGRRLILVALLLAVVLAPGLASASQPVPAGASRGALGVVTSPGESLARLWAWVVNLLPGQQLWEGAPVHTRGDYGPRIRPNEGSALDPYG